MKLNDITNWRKKLWKKHQRVRYENQIGNHIFQKKKLKEITVSLKYCSFLNQANQNRFTMIPPRIKEH